MLAVLLTDLLSAKRSNWRLVRNSAHLIKVQTYDNVGLLRLLVNHFQEVNMADVWRRSEVKAETFLHSSQEGAHKTTQPLPFCCCFVRFSLFTAADSQSK